MKNYVKNPTSKITDSVRVSSWMAGRAEQITPILDAL